MVGLAALMRSSIAATRGCSLSEAVVRIRLIRFCNRHPCNMKGMDTSSNFNEVVLQRRSGSTTGPNGNDGIDKYVAVPGAQFRPGVGQQVSLHSIAGPASVSVNLRGRRGRRLKSCEGAP